MQKVAFLLVLTIVVNSCSGKLFFEKVSKEEAINIANKKVVEIGYDLNNLKLEACWDKKEWEEFFKQFEYPPMGVENFLDEITDNSSWTIFYTLKEADDKGRQLFVLVDKKTGKINSIKR